MSTCWQFYGLGNCQKRACIAGQWATGNTATKSVRLARRHTPTMPITQLGYGFPPNRSLGNGGGQPPIAQRMQTLGNAGQWATKIMFSPQKMRKSLMIRPNQKHFCRWWSRGLIFVEDYEDFDPDLIWLQHCIYDLSMCNGSLGPFWIRRRRLKRKQIVCWLAKKNWIGKTLTSFWF